MKSSKNTPHLDPLPSSDEGRGKSSGTSKVRRLASVSAPRYFLSPSEGERIKVRGLVGLKASLLLNKVRTNYLRASLADAALPNRASRGEEEKSPSGTSFNE